MSVLAQDSTLPGVHLFLIGAGVIMTAAIWTSKKAQQVVQSTINLSSQNESEEVFSSSKVARTTVRNVLNFNSKMLATFPKVYRNGSTDASTKTKPIKKKVLLSILFAPVSTWFWPVYSLRSVLLSNFRSQLPMLRSWLQWVRRLPTELGDVRPQFTALPALLLLSVAGSSLPARPSSWLSSLPRSIMSEAYLRCSA